MLLGLTAIGCMVGSFYLGVDPPARLELTILLVALAITLTTTTILLLRQDSQFILGAGLGNLCVAVAADAIALLGLGTGRCLSGQACGDDRATEHATQADSADFLSLQPARRSISTAIDP